MAEPTTKRKRRRGQTFGRGFRPLNSGVTVCKRDECGGYACTNRAPRPRTAHKTFRPSLPLAT
jgi:hypothetical protein